MPDSAPPPPAPAPRRGPPPIPRALADASGPIATASSMDELVEIITSELEALADGDAAAKKRAADLAARAALLLWDASGNHARALQVLGDAEHPVASALRLHAAIERNDQALLDACIASARARHDKEELADLAGFQLWKNAKEAAELYGLAAEAGAHGRSLALGVAGLWKELVEAAEKNRAADPAVLAASAHAAHDRLDDVNRARKLLERALDHERGPGVVFPYLAERLVELESPRTIALFKAKLEALGEGAAVERAATRYLLAAALERGGDAAAAQATIRELCEAEEPQGAAAHLAFRVRARLDAKASEWPGAAEAWERLAELGAAAPAWSAAYARRAAELWEARANDARRAEALWLSLHAADPADEEAALALARLRLLRGAVAEAAGALEGFAHAAGSSEMLKLAARAREVAHAAATPASRGTPAPTVSLASTERWRAAAAIKPDRVALEALARAYRAASDRPHLIETYRQLASAEPRRAAAYLSVAGALLLDQGELDEAELQFAQAAQREPDDLLALAGRVLVMRRRGHWAELGRALESVVALARSRTVQARMHRDLARLASEHLKSNEIAHKSYEKALELVPDDVTTLHAFARLLGEGGKWNRAVELRERAAQASAEANGPRAAVLLVEIGEIYEKRLSDDENARKSYERALDRDERSEAALALLAAMHRRHRRIPELLGVLRHELKRTTDPARVLELQLEVAQAADEGGDVQSALDAWRAALEKEPAHPAALAGMERVCRREKRWTELAQAFERAPTTVKMLRVLAEAFEHLEKWEELAQTRESELALLSEPREIVRAARTLAELYESRQDLDSAARAWHRMEEADPRDPQAARALQRIYESRGRYADLAAAIERELSVESQLETDRRLELWLRLADIRRSRLSRADAAAEAFERALQIDPRHGDALAALAELYAAANRSEDLNRVLDLRAQATGDPQQRAAVLQQKGDLMERSGDFEGALAAYSGAFQLDAGARACFTAYERVCYRLERWRQAMELYDAAIELVENQRSRAYRLADLYARRGQLQLQYLGQPGEAAASYLRVLELDPESDTAQSALERIFSAQSDWHGLIAAYERRTDLVKDDTRRVEILRRAARVAAAKVKDPLEAARLYGRLHSVDPTDSEGLDALERHYERAHDWEHLIQVLTTRLSLTAGGDEAIALYQRIAHMCEDGLHDAERTIEAYRKILDIAPSHKDAIEALGRLYEGTEKWAELVDVTRRQIRIVSDRAQKALLYFKCGSVMESKFAKEDDAIRYYDAAIKTSPSCLPAVHGLRDLYLRKEDWPRVIQTLELEAKLWTEDKERAGVFAHIGQIYGDKLGDQERAIQYYESALTVDKECLPANRALFELYFARGEFQRALPIAVILTQKVTREGDPVERSEFYRKRAVVAEKTGDQRAAAESVVVALEIRPENMEALDRLVGLCRAAPDAYDFLATFRELEKLYRKRNDQAALARVMTAQGALRECQYDVDGAEAVYLEALRLASEDYPVVDALVSLHEKLRRFDSGAAVLEAFLERAKDVASRSRARYRLAELYGDGAMDAKSAAETLEQLIEEDPDYRDAYFRLAQELYLLGRYAEAHRACERLIQLAAQPGRTVPPEELARYYDYLGRIAEAAGDAAAAGRSYRRASDLDPSYAPSALALARRAALSPAADGRAHAQEILDEALRAAEARGPESEMPLRRGIARFFVSLDDRDRAIEAYRAVLARAQAAEGELLEDRVALADLLAASPATMPLAREELLSVLNADLRHLPAYRLLMHVYQHSGEGDRAARVANVLALLGYAGEGDPMPPFRASVKRGTLTDELRRANLLPGGAQGPLTDALLAVRETLDQIYGVQPPANAVPVAQVNDPALKVCVGDTLRLFGMNAEVWVASDLPGGMLMLDGPRPTIYLSATLTTNQPPAERCFLIGRALEPLRGGYAVLTRLRPQQRLDLARLLEQLLRPDQEREQGTQEFVRTLPRKSVKALERLQGGAPPPQSTDGGACAAWLAALERATDRAGLLACDDMAAAARMLSRLAGGADQEVPTALGVTSAEGVPELVRYFLSDSYHDLRATLGDASGRL